METTRNFRFGEGCISRAHSFVVNHLKKLKCSDRDITRAEVFTEETILFWSEKSNPGNLFQIIIRKRFNSISLYISFQGEPSNPLALPSVKMDKTDYGCVGQYLLIGLSTVGYTYTNGVNQVSFKTKVKQTNPVIGLIIAVVAASLFGMVLHKWFPSSGNTMNQYFLEPINKAFFGFLNAIVIPFLFISVVASFFNMENISRMKHILKNLFRWFAGFTLLAVVLALFAAMIHFPIIQQTKLHTVDGNVWGKMGGMIFNIIPSNLVGAFVEGNTLQVIMLALVFGITLLTLKGAFPIITKAIDETDQLFAKLLDIVCSLMPFIIFSTLLSVHVSGKGHELISALGTVVLIVAVFIIMFAFGLISLSVFSKVNPVKYMKTVFPVLLIALSTANSGTTYSLHNQIARKEQGVRGYLANFTIPVGALFLKPFMMITLFLLSLYMGYFYQLAFSVVDLIPMVLLCVILTIAVPPSAGMGVLLFTVSFKQFGIPAEGIAMAVTLYLFLDYLLTAGNVLLINISMVHTEKHLRISEGTLPS